MISWKRCKHDWRPSAVSHCLPVQGRFGGHGEVEYLASIAAMRGSTTFVYQCSVCKELRTVVAYGKGDFVKEQKQ